MKKKNPRWRRSNLSSQKTLAIFSRKRSLYSTRRLIEAAKQRGHRPMVFDTLRCNVVLETGAPKLFYRGIQVPPLDGAIPRIGASITSYGLAVVTHLESMGIRVANGAAGIAASRDKLKCLQLLARAGIAIPRTVMAHSKGSVPQLIEEVGGLPAIIKLLRGTQGVGVMIASTVQEAETIVETFWGLGQQVVLQEYIAEAKGSDIRALVVGSQVVGAMRRQAKAGEFRSNLHRGGEGSPIELPERYRKIAIEAAKVIGLDVAGVDLLESKSGPKIMELNSSPGFEGLEQATKVDVAGAMTDFAAGKT